MRNHCLSFFVVFFITLSLRLAAQSVTPVSTNDYCQFTVGNVFFEAAAPFGGRISSYKIDENEILFTDENYGEGFLWGSVLWPSPQNEWGWPPSQTLDIQAYDFEVQGNRCRMTSAISSSMDMRFIKDYYAAGEDTSITIVYKMVNEGNSLKNNAAWEVTRVPPSGLFFFPTGDASASSGLASYVQEINGYSWYPNQVSDEGGQKFFADGAQGWYAHVNATGYIFIKQFVEVPLSEQAPGESEIELWLNGDKAYMELENQSRYAEIAPGESLKYVVKWYLRKLPAHIAVAVDNAELVNFVTQTLGNEVLDPDQGTEIRATNPLAHITIGPNPAHDYIYVNDNQNRRYNLEIFTTAGQLIHSEWASANERLDIGNLIKGLYLVKLTNDSQTLVKRLIIK